MLSGSWKNTKMFCGNPNHTKQHEMTLQIKNGSPVYACSHCNNCMSTYLFEKTIDKCSKMIVDAMMNGEYLILTNTKWKNKTKIYSVLRHEDNEIDIQYFDTIFLPDGVNVADTAEVAVKKDDDEDGDGESAIS